MNEELKTHITSSKHWVRLVYMLLFSFFLYIASIVVAIVVVAQFVFALVTGSDNEKLRHLGSSIATYVKDVLMFLTFNSEDKAFPFSDWPEPQKDLSTVDAKNQLQGVAEDQSVVEPAASEPTENVKNSNQFEEVGAEQDPKLTENPPPPSETEALEDTTVVTEVKPRRGKAKREEPEQSAQQTESDEVEKSN